MIKLVPAKCPSCDANLKVNEKLEKTICQYCGTTVLITEAIQKVKVEHTGTVKVKGIKDANDYLENAKKEFKIKQYDSAIESCDKAIGKEKFNTEAHLLRVKSYIEKINNIKYDFDKAIRLKDSVVWNTICSFASSFDALSKSVEANDEDGFIGSNLSSDEMDIVNKYHKIADEYAPLTFSKDIDKVNKIMYDLMNLAWDVDKYKMRKRMIRIENALKEVISPDFSFGCNEREFDLKYRYTFHLISIDYDKIRWGLDVPGKEFEIQYDSIKELLNKVQEVYEIIKGYYDLSVSLANKVNDFIGRRGKLAEVRFYLIMSKLGIWIKYDEWYKFLTIENDLVNYYWSSDDCGSGFNKDLKKKINIYEFDKDVDEMSQTLIGKLFKK